MKGSIFNTIVFSTQYTASYLYVWNSPNFKMWKIMAKK